MYGSYGSYSAMATPMDTAPRPLSSRAQDASCAFPSWPRRSSLSASDCEEQPTSYLSDEDLFLGDAIEDDTHSVSSAGSCASPIQSPQIRPMTDADVEELERERAAHQREVVRFLLNEKERRRQQALRRAAAEAAASRRGPSSAAAASGSAKKSPKSKLSSMTPIAEAD